MPEFGLYQAALACFVAVQQSPVRGRTESFSMEGFANPLSSPADSSALFNLSFCVFYFSGSLMRGSSSLFGGAGMCASFLKGSSIPRPSVSISPFFFRPTPYGSRQVVCQAGKTICILQFHRIKAVATSVMTTMCIHNSFFPLLWPISL